MHLVALAVQLLVGVLLLLHMKKKNQSMICTADSFCKLHFPESWSRIEGFLKSDGCAVLYLGANVILTASYFKFCPVLLLKGMTF